MLTQQEILDARKKLGLPPEGLGGARIGGSSINSSTPASTIDINKLSNDEFDNLPEDQFLQLRGKQIEDYLNRVQGKYEGNIFDDNPAAANARSKKTIQAAAKGTFENLQGIGDKMATNLDMAGKDVKKNLETTFSPAPADTQDYGSFGKNFAADVSKRLASLGHIAGDIAGTAFEPLVHVAAAFIPDDIKHSAEKSAEWVTDKITKHPTIAALSKTLNANPDLKQSLMQDLPNTLALLGGEKGASPELKASELKNTVVGDVKAGINKGKDAIGVIDENLGKVRPAVEQKLAQRTEKTALDAITPKVENIKPTDYEKLLKQKRITPKTGSKAATYNLNESEKATALKYKDILQAKDPVKNSINVMSKIGEINDQVGEFLKKNNGAFNDGELKNYIASQLKDISDVTIPQSRVDKLKQTMIDNFVKDLSKNDMETLWHARQSFDSKIEKAFSGSPNLQNQTKRALRNAVQDFIAERTPDTTYKDFMKEMRNLFQVNDNIILNATKQRDLNGLKNWAKENPIKAALVGLGATSVGFGTVHTVYGAIAH